MPNPQSSSSSHPHALGITDDRHRSALPSSPILLRTAVRRGAAYAATGTRCGVQRASAPRGAQDVRMPTVSCRPVRVRACESTRPVSGVRVPRPVSDARVQRPPIRYPVCVSSGRRPASARPVHVQRPADGVRFRCSVSGIGAFRVRVARTREFVERVGAAGRPRWAQRVRRAVAVRGRRGRLPASGLMGRAGAALALPGSHEGRRQPRPPLGRRRCRLAGA
jgi:hypothetical protein